MRLIARLLFLLMATTYLAVTKCSQIQQLRSVNEMLLGQHKSQIAQLNNKTIDFNEIVFAINGNALAILDATIDTVEATNKMTNSVLDRLMPGKEFCIRPLKVRLMEYTIQAGALIGRCGESAYRQVKQVIDGNGFRDKVRGSYRQSFPLQTATFRLLKMNALTETVEALSQVYDDANASWQYTVTQVDRIFRGLADEKDMIAITTLNCDQSVVNQFVEQCASVVIDAYKCTANSGYQ